MAGALGLGAAASSGSTCSEAMSSAGADDVTMTEALLQPPLLAREWDAGFATLFTAAYRPASGRLDYHWPHQRLRLALDAALPELFEVELGGL